MSVTVSEIVVPSSAVSTTGNTTARARARRSRSSWVRSFRAWARIRRMVGSRRRGRPARAGGPLHDQGEDGPERGSLPSARGRADGGGLEAGAQVARRVVRVAIHDDVDAVAEERHAPAGEGRPGGGRGARRGG